MPIIEIRRLLVKVTDGDWRKAMPNVHFIGDIEFASISTSDVSVTWAIVPGNTAWYLKRGISYGETQTCVTSELTGKNVISHPIDCHYDCSSTVKSIMKMNDEYLKYSIFCNNHSLTYPLYRL
jgi:hypothetical protein